ncbi:hypothetical protein [Halalkalicoccus tibetensis]|uniref:Uncharacterized protein n=1 Tax=Halalkalicoccus tibetensis TaxID=175632 RepID=A0ABD5V168_9EURY
MTLGPGLTLVLVVIGSIIGVALLSPLLFAAVLHRHPPEGPPEDAGEMADDAGEADEDGSEGAEESETDDWGVDKEGVDVDGEQTAGEDAGDGDSDGDGSGNDADGETG